MVSQSFYKLFSLCLLASVIGGCSVSKEPAPEAAYESLEYPNTPRSQQQVTLHDQTIATPYKWLEQLNSEQSQQWVTQQQLFSGQQLASLSATDFIKERLTELFNVVQISAPIEQNGKIFYLRNDGLQSQASLYMQTDLDSPPINVVDATQLDSSGLKAITRFSVSPNANYLAYAVSEVGSDWSAWYIKDLRSGEVLDEVITGTKFTNVSWYPDSKGFYYSRYPRTDDGYNEQVSVEVFYHKLNTPVDSDIQVSPGGYQPGVNPYPQVSSDGEYLLLRVQRGPSINNFYIRPLKQTTAEFKPIRLAAGEHRYLGSRDNHLYFYSSQKDDTGQIVRVSNAEWDNAEVVIASQKLPLADAAIVGEQLFAHYLQDAQSRVMTFNLSGNYLRELALPGFGTVEGFVSGSDSSQTFFKFSSYTTPGNIYRYNADNQRTTLWHQSQLPVDDSRYQTEQVFVETSPGINVPVFLVHSKNAKQKGRGPLLLHTYGGFAQTLTPRYQPEFMAWLEMGGSLAIANVRGSGVYGSGWHQTAIKNNKPKAINDFLAVADWLVSNDYAEANKLVAYGTGHGGMLVTAAMLKRPSRFSVVLATAGVFDLLRYQYANANALSWQSEFGLSDNAEEFQTLRSYSPLHNVTSGTCYPATLLSTGAEDQRVAPWHSFKLAATLQRAQGCKKPILLDVDDNAGHGNKTPVWLQIERTHRQWSFAFNQLNVDWLKNSEQQ